jgi:hypothetical protein
VSSDHGSPGSHPHSDRPNWQPAETLAAYLANCREGLEQYSDRRAAKLMGMSRVALWRAKLMAKIPDDLFDELLKLRPSARTVALIAQALTGGKSSPDVERCPHCGAILRFRPRINANAAKVINEWLAKRRATS